MRTRGSSRLSPLIGLAFLLLLSACSPDERKEIRLIPTSTANPGVRIIVDNCPGPSVIVASVRDEVLWRIEDPNAPLGEAAEDGESVDATTTTSTEATSSAGGAGLREFLLGQTPDGWLETDPFDEVLSDGIRYTIRTEPDDESIDFSLPDLDAGLVFNGEGRDLFNADLLKKPCSDPPDFGRFARNLAVLGGLWITSAALVMVGLILLLFVVTRRFSRIRAIERRASKRTA